MTTETLFTWMMWLGIVGMQVPAQFSLSNAPQYALNFFCVLFVITAMAIIITEWVTDEGGYKRNYVQQR